MKITDLSVNQEEMESKIEKLLDELMPILKPNLPRPAIVISRGQSRTLGTCVMQWRTDSVTGQITHIDSNTTITLQSRIAKVPETLKRILAHELCHHEQLLLEERPKIQQYGARYYKKYMSSLSRTPGLDYIHGPYWKEVAERYNTIYGKGFVTPTSDLSTKFSDDAARPYMLLICKYNEEFFIQVSSRFTEKQEKYVANIGLGNNLQTYRVYRSTNPDVQRTGMGAGIGTKKAMRVSTTNPAYPVVVDLWNNGVNLAPQIGAEFLDKQVKAAIKSKNLRGTI